MTFGCHDTAMMLPQACARERDAHQKMAGELQMIISLYNVLIYLQIQLDIFSQTYSLVQRRGRALYLLCLKGSYYAFQFFPSPIALYICFGVYKWLAKLQYHKIPTRGSK